MAFHACIMHICGKTKSVINSIPFFCRERFSFSYVEEGGPMPKKIVMALCVIHCFTVLLNILNSPPSTNSQVLNYEVTEFSSSPGGVDDGILSA